ncbi:hypothetical protein M9458_013455, partial [Cirrhinus mrigala]
ASLFLECARFVHRCNRGNWPEWMKGHHVNITKRGLRKQKKHEAPVECSQTLLPVGRC